MHSSFLLKDIASYLGEECVGDGDIVIRSIAPIQSAGEGEITFLHNSKYKRHLNGLRASAIILEKRFLENVSVPSIAASDPYYSYAKLTHLFKQSAEDKSQFKSEDDRTSQTAMASLPQSASLGQYSIVAHDCVVGEGVEIGHHVSIGEGVSIGSGTKIYDNVVIYPGVSIGENAIIHSGVVVGADGFGFARGKDGSWCKIEHLGSVEIHDDVEIGANTTIDRGALNNTVIGKGVKLDNQIQIGHNVMIGENTIVAACAGIAGSAVIGNNCMIGGGACINGHIRICDGVSITGNSAVGGDIDKAGIYSGYPAQDHFAWLKHLAKQREVKK